MDLWPGHSAPGGHIRATICATRKWSRYLCLGMFPARAIVLMMFGMAKQAFCLLEQPVHGVTGGMERHPMFQRMVQLFTVRG